MFVFRRPTLLHRFCCTLAKCMEKECIVPDVIDKAPNEMAQICYPSGLEVAVGQELTPTQVKDAPCVKWKANACNFYLLCMIDPDAPSRECPKFREWHHWLVGNIPGCDVHKGDTLSEYIGAAPPEGTCYHRYVFLIFKQTDKLCFNEPRLTNCSADKRANFSIRKLTIKYKLCYPIAGNFFKAQYDCYVPFINKQLGL